jgi:uncharacterized membrane protein (DUF485 family)/uncharacterized small protein (DUF1192 family)
MPEIDFQFPMSDLVAVLPYVLPLIFIGIILLLFQRYLPRESLRRNIYWLSGWACFAVSFIVVLYAGFGSGWLSSQPFGSWWAFVGVVQGITDLLFGSIGVGVLYVVIIGLVFAALAHSLITPPNPDFVRLNEELKEAKEGAKEFKSKSQNLEAENKRLKEFVSEKEVVLTALQTELTTLKTQVGEGKESYASLEDKLKVAAAATESAEGQEEELLATISQKDQRIGVLQSELASLKQRFESTSKAASAAGPVVDPALAKTLETKLKTVEARLESYSRRAETATEVADSVISDMAQLMSQVETSKMDPQAKKVLTALIEGLGRAVGRISRPAPGKVSDEPKIEMIGAIMMIHEVLDFVKKMTRS